MMQTSAIQRRAMVLSQLRPVGVADPRLLAAMGSLAREAFVPASCRDIAYADAVVPLGHGLAMNPPATTGLLFEQAALDLSERVLVIGGLYAAAVGAALAAEVTALIDPRSPDVRQPFGFRVVKGPLDKGVPDHAPYDAIVIDGAIEVLPGQLIKQLREGGRLVTGVIEHDTCRLASGIRVGETLVLNSFSECDIVSLSAFAGKPAFVF